MKPILSLLVLFTVACGGLQSTESDCEDGFTKADDGACYPSAPDEGGGAKDQGRQQGEGAAAPGRS